MQESIAEPLVAKLKRRMATLRVGDPLDKNTDIGAINSRQQLERITELVRAGEEEGAEIFQPECRLPERGFWFAPTVFTNVAQSYRIAQEEIFGPGAERADVPYAGRGGREGEQHDVRALGGRVDGEGVAHPVDGGAARAPASCGRTPSTDSTRRRRSAATRSPGSAARAAVTGSRRT